MFPTNCFGVLMATCVATFELDLTGADGRTGWIIPATDEHRTPVQAVDIPDADEWESWEHGVDAALVRAGWVRTGPFLYSGPGVTARLVRIPGESPRSHCVPRQRAPWR